MNPSTIETPGFYINALNAFPNSVVPVATAVPAFIGYTLQASYQGESYLNVPVKVTGLVDFQAFFCWPDPPATASPTLRRGLCLTIKQAPVRVSTHRKLFW
jgi:hypothetical protein